MPLQREAADDADANLAPTILLAPPSALRARNRSRHTQRRSSNRNRPDRFRLPHHPFAHRCGQSIAGMRPPNGGRDVRRHCILQRVDLRDERRKLRRYLLHVAPFVRDALPERHEGR